MLFYKQYKEKLWIYIFNKKNNYLIFSIIIFIFLSNRTYPTRENTLLQTSNTRTRSQEIVYKSLIDSE